MMKLGFWVLILLQLCCFNSFTQTLNDSISLEKIEVYGKRSIDEKEAIQLKSLDSNSLNQSVFDKLKYGSHLLLRSTGVSGEIYAQSKGLQSRHTKVFWNNINVNTLGTGLADLSIYGNGQQNQIVVSDNILNQRLYQDLLSTAIYIDKVSIDKNVFALDLVQGSFKKWGVNYFQNTVHNNWTSALSLNYQQGKNDYQYNDYLKFPNNKERQDHAAFKKVVLESDHYIKRTQKNSLLQFNLMFALKDREIPPTLVSNNNDINQRDMQFRVNGLWKKYIKRSIYTLQLASINSLFDYKDHSLQIFSDNLSSTNFLRQTLKYEVNDNWDLLAALTYQLLLAKSDQIESPKLENVLTYFGSIHGELFDDQLSLDFLLRHHYQQNLGNYFSGQSDLTYQPKEIGFLELSGTFAYGNELPTLNERFWQPGGNVELRPENALKGQIGLSLNWDEHEKINFNYQSHVFLIRLNDMIQWLPTNKSYWQPVNVAEVRNFGSEQMLNMSYTFGHSTLKGQWLYNHTLSQDRSKESIVEHRQMIYQPKHTFSGSNAFLWKETITLECSYQYISDRFVTQDNLYYLNAYWLLNASIAYRLPVKRMRLGIQFDLNNLTNNQYYQEIAHIPMPGINYQLGIRIQYE